MLKGILITTTQQTQEAVACDLFAYKNKKTNTNYIKKEIAAFT